MIKPILVFSDDNFFLSNFYMCPVLHEGIMYPSSEHAYQASKFEEFDIRSEILAARSPAKAKEIGRKYPISTAGFDINRPQIMKTILLSKFSHPDLAKKLIATKHAYLAEGNYHNDTYWGFDLRTFQGLNHLGEVLMDVREEITNVLLVGTNVIKTGGDYTFQGTVAGAFTKIRSGEWRYNVEHASGMIMIYSRKNLKIDVERPLQPGTIRFDKPFDG